MHARQLIAHVPVLKRAKLRKVGTTFPGLGGIDIEIVLIHPAQPRGIGTKLRLHPFRHGALQVVQALQHPRPGKVSVHLVIKDDGDQREAEHGGGTHFLDASQPLQAGGKRKGDLVFHLLRAASHPLAIHEHLVLRQVRDGVHRCEADGAHAERDNQQRGAKNQETVLQAPVDDELDHGRLSPVLISLAQSCISLPKKGLLPGRPPVCTQ